VAIKNRTINKNLQRIYSKIKKKFAIVAFKMYKDFAIIESVIFLPINNKHQAKFIEKFHQCCRNLASLNNNRLGTMATIQRSKEKS
jgi:predicted KAP-like P-loop ATPase